MPDFTELEISCYCGEMKNVNGLDSLGQSNMTGFFIGLFVGANIGFIAAAMFASAGRDEKGASHEQSETA